ncbi:MAG: substrate-binding domain-containing protein [Anaerovoracaceae bacterium]
MKRRILSAILVLIMVLSLAVSISACGKKTPENTKLILATTTSTKDSGLLDSLLPEFEKEYGYSVDVVSVGSGEAISLGEKGEADVLLVHSPAAEKKFVEDGHADEAGRVEVMYNDFVLVGPQADPAKVEATAKNDAAAAFTAISTTQSPFISRGDESGTHKKELSIWKAANITPAGDWYVEAADGMGAVITMADEKTAYTLADRATWLNVGKNTQLKILCEKDEKGTLNNQYAVICVNPEKNENINKDGAKEFQNWLTSKEVQKKIGEFGVDKYGEQLFVPNAK